MSDDQIENKYRAMDSNWAESNEGINSYFVVFLSLLALVLVLSKILSDRPKLAKVLPEAGMTIIVGIIAGYGIFLATPVSSSGFYGEANNNDDLDDDSLFNGQVSQNVAEGLLAFSPKVFFFILLPPIIFNSGYSLKGDLFFRHITPISLFACAGALISTFVIAIFLEIVKALGLIGGFNPHFTELLTFGALISATDPVSTLAVFQTKKVDPQLFYLVFGESVLNDAVGLVLFNTASKFVGQSENIEKIFFALLDFLLDFFIVFVGSMLVGMLAGIASAFFFKKMDMRQNPLLEMSSYVLIMYLPFFTAELIGLSGIVTIIFTGIFAKRYASLNLSETTESNVEALFRVTAHLAETSIFLELGLSVFGLSSSGNLHWQFILWAMLACLFGRAMNIYPLSYFYNIFLQREVLCGACDNIEMKNVGSNTIIKEKDHRDEENAENINTKISSENISRTEKLLTDNLSMTPSARRDLKIGNKTSHMLWFSGLRGAVAYACSKKFPEHYGNETSFVVTTMAIILFTVFFFGCSTNFVLEHMKIKMNVDEDKYMEENGTEDKMGFLASFENTYINPFVIRDYNHESNENSKGYPIGTVSFDTSTFSAMSPNSSYMPQIERTRSEHLDHLRKENQISPEMYRRRKQSLYDYGFGL